METARFVYTNESDPSYRVKGNGGFGDGYFKVSGGPLSGEMTMGVHIVTGSGHTLGVSCDVGFARLACLSPMMARCIARLLMHYHQGDELKDFADDLYECAWEIFGTKDTDAICNFVKEKIEY